MVQKKSPKKSKIKKEILDFDLLQEAESQEINENLNFSDNALEVLRRRYLKKDENKNSTESPAQLFRRVAKAVALADKNYKAKKEDITKTEEIFYQMMVGKDFLPNSPTMMNAGRSLGQLSACFVLPIGDSIPEIFQAITEAALIHKSGGGTGFSFSRLRPKGSMVGSTAGVASGPVSFMRIFDSATEEIKQGGTRRGANMGILRIDHPDILEFVKFKEDLNQMRNFNISVAVTDEFMKALNNNSLFALRDPRDKKIIEEIPAKQIFDEIVHQAWLTGDPGLVFIDRINQLNPLKKISEIEATNPCGEQPLPPYDSCNLGSINLANFVDNHKINWTRLKEIIWQGVHFLDNIIDVNNYPISQIAKTTCANRRIGLGIMGFADLLLYIGIPYDSPLALQTAKKIANFFQRQAIAASMALAKKRGNFPSWKDSIYAPKQSMRNATATTVAPTGTISMIADCSSGIEPLYAVAFTKTVMDRTKLIYVHPYFEQLAKKEGWYSKELMEEIVQKGTIEDSSQIPDHIKKLFVCAHQISPTQHVLMQAAFQQFIDSGVSKTINLRNNATEDDVRDALILAYKHGCKGITVFRDGCRREQVLTKGTPSPTEPPLAQPPHVPRERPSILYGSTEKIPTGLGNVYVTVNEDNKGPFEVFATIGKSGGDASSFSEAIGRLISLCLRSGIEVAEIIDHLKGIRGPNPVWQNGELILSCPDAIGKALERYIQKKSTLKLQWEQKLTSVLPVPENMAEQKGDVLCPECGSAMKFSEGCFSCPNCGYSKCG